MLKAVQYLFYGSKVVWVDEQPYAAQCIGIHRGKRRHGFVLEVKRYAGILQQVLKYGNFVRVSKYGCGYKMLHRPLCCDVSTYKVTGLNVIISLKGLIILLVIRTFPANF